MVYQPQGLTKSRIFFYILDKGKASFDEIDIFMKRKLGLGKGKGLDTVKDVLWSLISSKVVYSDNLIKERTDRNMEKSFFSVRELYGLVDLAIVYLTVYTWGKDHARQFQKSTLFKNKISFNLEDLQKIISGNADSGILPDNYSFLSVLSKLPPEDPRTDSIYFYCEDTDGEKYRKFKKILVNNLQLVGDDIKKTQPFSIRLLSKFIQLNYTFSEWNLPIFQHFKKRLENSPDFAMSFFRVVAEFLEETNFMRLPLSQKLQKAPQGLQQTWSQELRALDSRDMYHSRGMFSLWPKESSEAELETARRIRFNLKDDEPLANSKIGIIALFVIFLTLHGTVGDHDRTAIFSDIGLSQEDFQLLIDHPISFSQLHSFENLRCLKEEEWRTETLPKKREEIRGVLKARQERINKDPLKENKWTKEEAFALCMDRADVSIDYCYSLIHDLAEKGYAIVRE